MKNSDQTVIQLLVNNHPGVMSHITGLFSRRGYNLEGIFCGRNDDLKTSTMFLLVDKSDKYNQVLLQLEKLYDVLEICERNDFNLELFDIKKYKAVF